MEYPHLETNGLREVVVPALEDMARGFTGWELAELCHALDLDEATARRLFDVWLEGRDTAHLVEVDGLRYYYVDEDAAIYGDGDEGVCAIFPGDWR